MVLLLHWFEGKGALGGETTAQPAHDSRPGPASSGVASCGPRRATVTCTFQLFWRLRSQLRALDGEVSALRAAETEIRRDIRQLHSSFSALLEDALRHEAVLAALFGEEVMEEMSEEGPGTLPLRYEQIRVALMDAASGLQEQALGWDALAARVTALEQASGARRHTARLEPSRDASPEEVGGLAQELQRLSSDMERMGRCCEAAWVSSLNSSLEGLRGELSTTERGLERHQRLFHSLFGNFQGLVAANVMASQKMVR